MTIACTLCGAELKDATNSEAIAWDKSHTAHCTPQAGEKE